MVWAAFVVGFVSSFAAGCRRPERHGVERLAILPFENQTGDASWNWAAAAAQLILRTRVSASQHVQPVLAGSVNEARHLGATRVVQGYLSVDGGRLRLYATIQDAGTNKTLDTVEPTGDPAAGILPLVDAVAKRTGDRLRPFGTEKAQAIHAWGEAIATGDPAARKELCEKAIQLDPEFGEAYLSLAESDLLAGDRAAAVAVFERARSQSLHFTDYDRARIDLLAAEAAGNAGAQRDALVALSRLTTDSKMLVQLGELEYAARRFNAAAEAFRNALSIEPENPGIMNMLGYSYALAGNLETARGAFEQYRKALPNDPNPLDSMGEAYFFLGHFQEAEQSFLAADAKMPQKNGAELLKAAQARLFSGDAAGADAIFGRYLDARRPLHDPLLEIESARWKYVEGKQKEAFAALEAFAASAQPDVASYADAQLAIWRLAGGQAGAAQDRAVAAMQRAHLPSVRAAAMIGRFLTQPRPDAAQWRIAAEQAFGPGISPLKTTAIAYGMLFARQFGPASEIFRALYQQTQPAADGQVRTLYAWTLVESGRKADAAPLVATYPIVFGPGEALFSTLVFPRFFYVRAEAMQAQGNAAEARRARDYFRRFQGDLPDLLPPPR